MTVLLIDPDKNKLMQTRAVLEKNGDCVAAFCDAMAAVKYGYNHKVDAVYTEVVMPHLTGRDVVCLLRKQNPDIQAFFLTDTAQFVQFGKQCHAEGYYLKPLLEKGNENLLISSFVSQTR